MAQLKDMYLMVGSNTEGCKELVVHEVVGVLELRALQVNLANSNFILNSKGSQCR